MMVVMVVGVDFQACRCGADSAGRIAGTTAYGYEQ